MPKLTGIPDNVRNAQANAIKDLLNNGYLRIYDGTRPASVATAITTQVMLAEPRFAATAFPSATAGVLTANAMTADPTAAASGTATWARLFESDGTTPVMDVNVGTSDANIILTSVAIVAGAPVAINSFTYTVAATSAV